MPEQHHLHRNKGGHRPKLAEQMSLFLPPLAAEHHHEQADQPGLGKRGEDHLGQAQIEEPRRWKEILTDAQRCAGLLGKEFGQALVEDRCDGEILKENETEFGQLGDDGVEREHHSNGNEEGPSAVPDDGAGQESGGVVSDRGGEEDPVQRSPGRSGNMPPSHGPGGEREDGGGQEVFAQGQAEEVSQYLGQWGHGDESLVVDAPFVPFGDHAAGDLGGAHDK